MYSFQTNFFSITGRNLDLFSIGHMLVHFIVHSYFVTKELVITLKLLITIIKI
jgi:hypothetical protein